MADPKAFASPQCMSSEGGIQPLPCKDYSVDLPFAFAWSLLLLNLLLSVQKENHYQRGWGVYPTATEDRAHAELQAGPYMRTHGEHHPAPAGDSADTLLFCLCTKHDPHTARTRLAAGKCNHSLNSYIISESSSKACRKAFPKEFSCMKMASTACRKSLTRRMFY